MHEVNVLIHIEGDWHQNRNNQLGPWRESWTLPALKTQSCQHFEPKVATLILHKVVQKINVMLKKLSF